jgi:hypothetical protein
MMDIFSLDEIVINITEREWNKTSHSKEKFRGMLFDVLSDAIKSRQIRAYEPRTRV